MTQWRDWSTALTARVADAVKTRRTALGLSAAELAARTTIGKPLTRAVISDLETGRKKTLEVSELLTLAAALEIPPILLLFPSFPDGTVEVVPGVVVTTERAADWLGGRDGLPKTTSNAGTALVRAVLVRNGLENDHLRADLDKDIAEASGKPDDAERHERALKRLGDEINDLLTVITLAKVKLWGNADA